MMGEIAAKKREKNAFPEPDHPPAVAGNHLSRLRLAVVIRVYISVIDWQMISCPDQIFSPLFRSQVYVKGHILG